MRCVWPSAACATLAGMLLLAPSASATTEIGDPCVASTMTQGTTVFQLASPKAGLPLEAPVSGVITSWKLNAGSVSGDPLQTLKVFRVSREFVAPTNETQPVRVHAGLNVIPARLPINAGERIGLVGSAPVSDTLLCASEATGEDRIGAPLGSGQRVPYDELAGYRVPVRAVIEPDADRDGFGDETQDRCPQGTAFHSKCPRVRLRRSYTVGPNAVTVRVVSNRTTPIELFGTVKLGNESRAVLTPQRRVTAGKERRFRFPLPDAVRAARARLDPGEALILRLRASAVGVRGPRSSDSLRVRLTPRG